VSDEYLASCIRVNTLAEPAAGFVAMATSMLLTLAIVLCVASSARCFSTAPPCPAACLGSAAGKTARLRACGRPLERAWRAGLGHGRPQTCGSVMAQRGGAGDEGERWEKLGEDGACAAPAALREGEMGERVRWRRRFREDRTPRLCNNLRAGGCYNTACEAYHGKRYFDAQLGLWRTKSLFRQSTARPSHELVSVRAGAAGMHRQGGEGGKEVSGGDGNDGFVVKTVQGGVGGGVSAGAMAGAGISASPIAKSRAAASDVNRWHRQTGTAKMCERCQRPSKVCICSALPEQPIPIETRLIILQHPKERKKATYGTVPIVRLCIENVHVISANLNGPDEYERPVWSEEDAGKRHQEKKHVHEMKRTARLCEAFANDLILQEALERENTLLLFPDLDPYDPFVFHQHPELLQEGAVNLEEHFSHGSVLRLAEEAQASKEPGGGEQEIAIAGCTPGTGTTTSSHAVPRTLIAIDGTWAQAKAIYKHTPSLRKAMRVQFSKGASIKGEYTFRKEPKDNFLSTLESIAYCLTVLEPPPPPSRPREEAVPTGGQDEKTVSEWLMQAFKAMVNNQVQFLPRDGWSGAHAESEKV
jgi:DTW domain-containing protein YfiP